MRFLPRGTFGRIALLIGALLLVNQFISYYSVSIYIVQPFVRQIMHAVAMQVRVENMGGSMKLSPEISARYQQVTNIEAYNEKTAMEKGLQEAKVYNTLSDEINLYLDGPFRS